ncbi:MAG: hypothetical protein OEW67_07870 [Cyclobacteriaceae bacterium]|nr:hypothetical protein [Cyclobacteriaceae bacterium]
MKKSILVAVLLITIGLFSAFSLSTGKEKKCEKKNCKKEKCEKKAHCKKSDAKTCKYKEGDAKKSCHASKPASKKS